MPRDRWRRENNRTKYRPDSYERQKEADKSGSKTAARWIAQKQAEIAARKRERREERREAEARALVLVEATVSAEARRRGLVLHVNPVRCGKRQIAHWMFDTESGRRLLDYWPSNGTWWARPTGERGKVATPSEALEIATRVGAVTPDREPA